jgi:hypothetical protein
MIKILNFDPILKHHTSSTTFSFVNNTLQTWHNNNIEFIGEEDIINDIYLNTLYELCRHNYQIWHAEDYCRSKKDDLIVKYKPLIDKHNQLRNNTIEKIDLILIENQVGTGKANSETIGSIIDRMSITILKFLHTTDLNINNEFDDRLNILSSQIAFLLNCIDELYDDMINGVSYIQLFRQLKMYNDAKTNNKIPHHKDA